LPVLVAHEQRMAYRLDAVFGPGPVEHVESMALDRRLLIRSGTGVCPMLGGDLGHRRSGRVGHLRVCAWAT